MSQSSLFTMSGQLYTKNEIVTPEHAVILPALPGATSMDYVRAIAARIGASHIHSIHKSASIVKVYLKEKKYVRTVINAGVVVGGVLINVDFCVPPCYKVYLSNVDPIIPDKELQMLLGIYGTFESAIIHQKITGEEGFSHIEGSSRVVYMKINEGMKVPSKLNLVYGKVLKEIDVKVEAPMKEFKFSSSQTD